MAGLVLLLFGWRLYRVLLVMVSVCVTGLAAAWAVRRWGTAAMLAVGAPLGALGGLLSRYVERYGVFLIGGAAGAAPVLDSRVYFFSDHTMYFAALASALIAGSLAVLFWRPGIILSFSVLGAVFLERGALLLAEQARPGLGERIVGQYQVALCLTLLGMVLLGVLAQDRESRPADAEATPGAAPPVPRG
jgi:hypothetical protein